MWRCSAGKSQPIPLSRAGRARAGGHKERCRIYGTCHDPKSTDTVQHEFIQGPAHAIHRNQVCGYSICRDVTTLYTRTMQKSCVRNHTANVHTKVSTLRVTLALEVALLACLSPQRSSSRLVHDDFNKLLRNKLPSSRQFPSASTNRINVHI